MRFKFWHISSLALLFGYLLVRTMEIKQPLQQKAPTQEQVPFYSGLNTTLTTLNTYFTRFQSSRNKFIEITNEWLNNPNHWITPQNQKIAFAPYVQRIQTQPGDTFFIFGDLHGDLKVLLNSFKKLLDEEILSPNLKLRDKHHLVFLGDYVDRGFHSVETWHILLSLRIANPDPASVVILRGNHEDYAMNYDASERFGSNGYLAELRTKFALASYSFETIPNNQEKKFETIKQGYISLTERLYNLLPVALYLECGDGRVMFVHGGLEIGFDPQPLLQEQDPAKIFMPVGTLLRATEMKKISPLLDGFKENLKDFLPSSPVELQFLWNDFKDTDPTEKSSRGQFFFELGPTLTQTLLNRNGLHCIFRGHQHEYTNTASQESIGLHSSPYGLVHTLISYSQIPMHKKVCEKYSFIKLQPATTLGEWKAFYLWDNTEKPIDLTRKNVSPGALSPMPPTVIEHFEEQAFESLSLLDETMGEKQVHKNTDE